MSALDIQPYPEPLHDNNALAKFLRKRRFDFFITLEFGRNINSETAKANAVIFCEKLSQAFNASGCHAYPEPTTIRGLAFPSITHSHTKFHLLIECTEKRLLPIIAQPVWTKIERLGSVHFCQIAEHLLQPHEGHIFRDDVLGIACGMNEPYSSYMRLLMECYRPASAPESAFLFGYWRLSPQKISDEIDLETRKQQQLLAEASSHCLKGV